MYHPLPAHVDLVAMDHEVIEWWGKNRVFTRSLEQTAGGPSWTFYEGPPTANGMPGTHHVEARVFKDVFPRFKTMKGYHVPRIAGWDCHGLPVELAVEKELGFTGKPDIEAYGIAPFNARCRENVQRHVDAFEQMSERMGYWADYDNAYWTMRPDYVESVWWALKTIFDKGLLVEDYRVAPYCPRCGTGLSDHEVAQGYEDVTDPSVYVRFPLTSGPWAGRADLLIWTTTPWTLVSNTAVAVHPFVEYVVARSAAGTFVVARPLLDAVLGEQAEVLDSFSGAELERWTYRRPFELVELSGANFVVLAEYVTTEDGTGLVHQAPAFGADDLAVCRSYDLPVVTPIGPDGHFAADLDLVGGSFFKDADEALVADLRERGLLFRHVPYTHSYPHCWRCHTPLMYFALPSWYVRTTAVKDRLLAENEATTWYPATIKHGRYGDWLTNNIDWALSRDRYWGTPLPVWRNDADPSRMVCVGSLAELRELSGIELDDPHRPFVDDVTFTRPGEAGTYRRVPQVIDAWFDSGSMPFAQFGAPHHNAAVAAAAYPADFICEAIDQTRGWFYSLMAVGTLVQERNSYRTVLCLGHILAEDGRKMSKHLGNILEPIPLMDRHGADALRWFMLCSGSPWASRRVGHKVLDEIASKVLRTYWSIASFQSLYARANGWAPDGSAGSAPGRTALDRWALSEAHRTAGEVDAALEDFDTQRAGRALAGFIDDLSNWYVRRSRRRFWDGDPAALATLHECLDVLTRLLAPFVPFVTERVWGALFAAGAGVDSVHLAPWPAADPAVIDVRLGEQVALVRRLVELGRAARADAKMKTRQPLAQALVSAPGLGGPAECAAGRGARGAQRGEPVRAGRRRGARGAVGEAQLPRPRPPIRQAHPGGRRGDRRRRPGRIRRRLPGRHRRGAGRRRHRVDLRGGGGGRRDAALGLGGRLRRRRHRRPGPRAHPRAAAARAGPRHRPVGAGGPQERRAGGHRPDRAVVAGRRLARAGRGAAHARAAVRGRGAGGPGARGRARARGPVRGHRRGARAAHLVRARGLSAATRGGGAGGTPPAPPPCVMCRGCSAGDVPASGLGELALRRSGAAVAVVGHQVAQLRLEVALEPVAVLVLEGAQLLQAPLQRGLALLELGGDAGRALLGLLDGVGRAGGALLVQLAGPRLGLTEVLLRPLLRLGDRRLALGPRVGEQPVGLGPGLREVLVGRLLGQCQDLHGLLVRLALRRPAGRRLLRLGQLLAGPVQLRLGLREVLADLAELLLDVGELLLQLRHLLLGSVVGAVPGVRAGRLGGERPLLLERLLQLGDPGLQPLALLPGRGELLVRRLRTLGVEGTCGTGLAAGLGAQVVVLLDQPGQLHLDDVEEGVDLLLVVAALADRRLLERDIVDFGGSQRHSVTSVLVTSGSPRRGVSGEAERAAALRAGRLCILTGSDGVRRQHPPDREHGQ